MSRTTKIVLGVIGGLVALCCLITGIGFLLLPRFASQFADQVFSEDPAEAREVAGNIVDYDLPLGFNEEGAMNLFGISMVFMASEAQDGVIMLMSFPESLAGNEAEMQSQMEQAFNDQIGQQNVSLVYAGTEDFVINGENTTVNYFEGTDENGVAIRQATAVFADKSGNPAMFMIFAPTAAWERSDLVGFIESLE